MTDKERCFTALRWSSGLPQSPSSTVGSRSEQDGQIDEDGYRQESGGSRLQEGNCCFECSDQKPDGDSHYDKNDKKLDKKAKGCKPIPNIIWVRHQTFLRISVAVMTYRALHAWIAVHWGMS